MWVGGPNAHTLVNPLPCDLSVRLPFPVCEVSLTPSRWTGKFCYHGK